MHRCIRCIDVYRSWRCEFFASFRVSEVGEKLKKCVRVLEREKEMRTVNFCIGAILLLCFIKDAAGGICENPCSEDRDCPPRCDDDGMCVG